ncbi:MICOS complex subunit MIC27 isoform X1 [Pangasianodon hypophthalmus]|uniref:MICOS complex subunit MIC27 isoform X1 n=1 Tax=Pangasianodon hypophthalmus TaxID=310915 RepID=UPI000EFE6B72|nr:MICOS complex subunit MIC27 isoform X1 [Pangasianodon hypophthalmus]
MLKLVSHSQRSSSFKCAFQVVKVVAVPVVLGFASLRVYSMSKDKPEVLLSPQQLSIYSTLPQERLHYSEEQPGVLQSSLGKVRGSLQSYVQKMKSAYVSVQVTAVNLYHGGEDVYYFLKDPPSGFVPRISVIAVSGLAGVILARKGSYLKKLGLPLSLASAGFAVCYPVQTIAMLKVSGKKMYAASEWTSSTVASLWKQDTLPVVPASLASAPSPEAVANTQAVPVSELAQATGTEALFREASPPPESRFSPMPDDHDLVPASFSFPQNSISTADDELLVVTVEGKPSSASSLTTESQPETPSLQSSGELQTPTAVAEKQEHESHLKLMDFGQSYPEDADLYSTRS